MAGIYEAPDGTLYATDGGGPIAFTPPMTTTKEQTMDEKAEPARIFLMPQCCVDPLGEGRQWCEDDVWGDCTDCDCQNKANGVPYILEATARATIAQQGEELARMREALEAAQNVIDFAAAKLWNSRPAEIAARPARIDADIRKVATALESPKQ